MGINTINIEERFSKIFILANDILFGGVFLKKISIVILVCLIAVGVLMTSGCTDVEKTSSQVQNTVNEISNAVNENNNPGCSTCTCSTSVANTCKESSTSG